MKNKILGIILTIILVASFGMAIPVSAEITPTTLVVGSTEYPTIQSAIDDAVAGDIVQIPSGTYSESILVGVPINIIGTGDTKPIIAGSSETYIIKIDSVLDVTLDNLEIDGGLTNTFTSGILINSSGTITNPIVIQNCTVKNIWINSSAGEGAITIKSGSYTIINNCKIESFEKRGVSFIGSDGIVSNSEIIGDNVDGTERVQDLIVLWSDSNAEIFGNILRNALTIGLTPTWDSPAIFVCAYNGGIASSANIHNNEIYNCDTGIVIGSIYTGADGTDESTATIANNTFHDLNTFINTEQSSVSFVLNDNIFNMTEDKTVVDGLSLNKSGTGNTFNVSSPAKIEEAIESACAGDTINISSGTYLLGQVVIGKNLTINGDSIKPVINPVSDYAGTNAVDAWILVNDGVTFNLSNLVLNGLDKWVYQAIRSHGNSTIENVDFLNIQGSLSGSPYRGVAIESFGGTIPAGAGSDTHVAGLPSNLLVVNGCTFQQIGRIGIIVKGDGATAQINDITYTGKGDIDCLDYGIEVGAGGNIEVTNSTITNNLGVASVDDSTSAGILITDYFGTGTQATITGNTLTGNTDGIAVGYDETDESIVTAHENNLSGNVIGLSSTHPLVDATLNWWGNANANLVTFNVGITFDPWWAIEDGSVIGINNNVLTYTAGTGGSITGITPQTVPYDGSGTEVIAIPDSNYHFTGWSDGVLTESRTDSNIVTDLNVMANFAIDTFTLTYTAGAGGTITGVSTQTIDYGLNGTEVIASTNSGYQFVGWSDGLQTNTRTDTNIIADINVTANFVVIEIGGGGGGGGGGAESPIPNIVYPAVDENGKVYETVTATTQDGKADVTIPENTTMQDKNGHPLHQVRIDPAVNVPELPKGENVVGIPYECSPNGATFNPAITITFKYDPANVPSGMDLKVVFWNGTDWVELTDIVVDPITGTVSGKTTHFTKFALIAVPKLTPTVIPTTPAVVTPVVTSTVSPTVQPTVTPIITPTKPVETTTVEATRPFESPTQTMWTMGTITPEPVSNSNSYIWVIIFVGVVLVICTIVLIAKRKKK